MELASALREHVVLSEEVREGIRLKKPVIGLESTIISHGMPYPQNFEVASEIEDIAYA